MRLPNGANTARLQSDDSGSNGDNMHATNVILIVEKSTPAPSIEITLGSSTVKLTDMVPGQDARTRPRSMSLQATETAGRSKHLTKRPRTRALWLKVRRPFQVRSSWGRTEVTPGTDFRLYKFHVRVYRRLPFGNSQSEATGCGRGCGGTYGSRVTFTGSIS